MEKSKETTMEPSKETTKPLGALAAPHPLLWDLKTYATFGHGHDADASVSHQVEYTALSESDNNLVKYCDFSMGVGCNLDGFQLVDAKCGQHYMGKDKNNADINKPVVVLRYTDVAESNSQLGGEHVSFTIDISDCSQLKLLGFVDMRDKEQSGRVAHQQALDTAVSYLQNHAPDLVPAKACSGHLGDFDRGAHVEFNDEDKAQVIQNSKLNVLWIGEHTEKIWSNDKEKTLTGIKVKMHDPDKNLFHWVIVSDQNNVMVCERNISWHGDKFRRETQMPLHDRSIAAQTIAKLSTLWKTRSSDGQLAAASAPQPPSPRSVA